MKISIIGTGIYGIAIALNIAKNNHNIMMWSENENLAKYFQENHNFMPLTDVEIPRNISVTSDINETIKDTDLIIIATAAKYVRDVCKNISHISKNIPICIASKGIENDTCSFLSDIVSDILKAKHIGVISGPTFAIDLINGEPCALSLAVNSKKTKKIVTDALASPFLKLRANYDLIGTEVCGSIKNVIAIAAGILDGLGYHESTRCFLITEALHDIKELLSKLECTPNTILSFAGIGDLMLTCSSPKSRNYKFGIALGKKENKDDIQEYLKNNTTEGYYTLFSIKELTKNRKIKMPIINIIYDIVINNKNPEILPEFLINKS